MAEARLGVAFGFNVTNEGVEVNLDRELFKLMARFLFRSIKRRCNSVTNTFLKGVYPASPATWLLFLVALASAQYKEHGPTIVLMRKVEGKIPAGQRLERVTMVIISTLLVVTTIWVSTGIALQYILRVLLANFTFLRSGGRGKIPMGTKVWLVVLRLLSGFSPGTFSFQKCLPILPLPTLRATIQKYLSTVKPIMTAEEFAHIEKLSQEFQHGEGEKLQRYLWWKRLWSPNYVSDWWERFVYLRSRDSLMINSNYTGLGGTYAPLTTKRAARAGNLIHAALLFRKLIERERLQPLKMMGCYPLCSVQYGRMFNTTRLPGKEEDVLAHFDDSNYVVVYHRGRYFKMFISFHGKLLKPSDLQLKLEKLVDCSESPCEGEEQLAALTSANRAMWADARERYFTSAINKESLDCIEKAAFIVVLDEQKDYLSEKSSQSELNQFTHRNLHGQGYDRWLDKSFNLIIDSNCQVAINVEHSWGDAPVMAQCLEWMFAEDILSLKYKENGDCFGKPLFDWPTPKKLNWDLSEECRNTISTCVSEAQQQIADFDMETSRFTKFGKGEVKQMKCSPDAFCQLAIQLAYFKSLTRSCLTYEAAMTRGFREGRTETVRTCTEESVAFTRAAVDPAVPRAEKRALFTAAADVHVSQCREAMVGEGIDRHLFCLYVVSKYLKLDVPFLNSALNAPWTLSTSQCPANQNQRLDIATYPEHEMLGGGFGPVSSEGYGICYTIMENVLVMHVSSKKSCKKTDSSEFVRLIHESMVEMRGYFD